MQAVILAAGMGKRLGELTRNNTKCMVEVNGITLIDRMLHQLEKRDLSRIIVVAGYEGKKLVDYIGTLGIRTPLVFIDNPVYDRTNNIYSLALAKDWLCREDTLLFESDIIFEDDVLDLLIRDPRDTLALVDRYESWMDGTCFLLSEEDDIAEFVPGTDLDFSRTKDYYKTVNIYKFSRRFSESLYVPFLEAYQAALGENVYYEQVLRVIAMLDEPGIKALRLNGQLWYEIDDIQDLDIAESLFAADGSERLRLRRERYGGYWRYPKMLDFCYLVNPYFPTGKMKDEMKAAFDDLLTQYPSGMKVNALLAAADFGVRPENMIPGNGAAELIRSLMGLLRGKTGFVRPTFEEYPNRYSREESEDFVPGGPDYSYTADDLMRFFGEREIRNLVIVNPDNPTGNYIPKADMLRLAGWARRNGIRLIADESFADFAEEPDNTLIDPSILAEYPELYVIKSISKACGVPGIRLGVLASGDTETVAELKKDVPIWNINSFGEFFLQLFGKYRKAYEASLFRVREERTRFRDELCTIKGIRPLPSQANFIMAELEDGIDAERLSETLLTRYHLFVKDLTEKTGGRAFLRFAVRSREENGLLADALRKELEGERKDHPF